MPLNSYPCYVSEKLDGWRCLIVDGIMYTSGGKEFKRETLIGKIVDFEFLSGVTKGRMGRIFRLREDIIPGTSLGL